MSLNPEVSMLVASINHPLESTITDLREFILELNSELFETIKWNGPNFVFLKEDRITLRVQSPKLIQIILHCGAKKQTLSEPLISHESALLEWKSNDRAVITFKTSNEFEQSKSDLKVILTKWLHKG